MKEVDYYTEDNTFVATVEFEDNATPEYISEYLEKYGPEIQYAEGLAEPGFGPLTMGLVPAESIERGFYGARQVGATLGAELGLLDKATAAEDIAKMERYKEYSREQARREDFASGELVTDPETGRQVREGELEYYEDLKTLQDLSKAETFSDAMSTLASNPGAVLPIIGESLGLFAPALAGTVAVGIATGGAGVPGIIATALTAGLGSGATEYGASFLQSFSENGVDVADDEQVIAALNNEEKLSEIREDAAKRGIAIGAFDAATVGFAGKLTSLIKGAPLSQAATEASLLRRVGAGTAEAGAQAVGGGSGEAAAQALTGEYKPGEILLEAVAEVPTALPEVALGARATRARKLRRALEERGYTDAQINEFGSMSGNQQNKIVKELNEKGVSETFMSEAAVNIREQNQRREDLKAEEARANEAGEETGANDLVAPTEPASNPDFIVNPEGQVIEAVGNQPAYTAEELNVAAQELASEAVIREESTQDAEIRKSFTVLTDTFNTMLKENRRPDSDASLQEALTKFETQVEEKYPGISSTQKLTIQKLLRTNQPLPEKVTDPEFGEYSSASEITPSFSSAVEAQTGRVPTADARIVDFLSPEQREEAGFDPKPIDRVTPTTTRRPAKTVTDTTGYSPQEVPAEQKPAQEFIVAPPTPEEQEFIENNDKLEAQASDSLFTDIYTRARNSPDFNLSQAEAVQVANERIKYLTAQSDNRDLAISEGNANAAGAEVDYIAGEKAVAENNRKIAVPEINEDGSTKSDAKALAEIRQGNKSSEMLETAPKNLKDMKKFASWWVFPDVAGHRYPLFAPYWQAVSTRKGKINERMTQYFLPIMDTLNKIKTSQSQTNIMKALELLDQTSQGPNAPGNKLVTDGVLDPSKVDYDAERERYILTNPGGENVRTLLTDAGRNNKIELTQEEMNALVAIRSSFNTAKADIIAAFNPDFFIEQTATPAQINDLVRQLRQADEESFRQIIEDSNIIIKDDPDSFFSEFLEGKKTQENILNFLTNYTNSVSVFNQNLNYLPHMRFGDVGIRVRSTTGEDDKTLWFGTYKPTYFKKTFSLVSPDFNAIEDTKKYKLLKAKLQAQYPNSTITLQNLQTSVLDEVNNADPNTINNILQTLSELRSSALTAEENAALSKMIETARNKLVTITPSVDPSRQQARKNIPGWVTNETAIQVMNDTINMYFGRAASYVGDQATKRERRNAIKNMEDNNLNKLADYAKDLDVYLSGGHQDVLHLRRIAFHYYLGLNPSSAVVNLTQIPMASVPWLVRYTSSGRAQRELLRGLRDAGKIAGLVKGLKRTGTGTVAELLKLENPLGTSPRQIQLWEDMKVDLLSGRLMAQVTAEQAGIANYGGVSDLEYKLLKSGFNRAESISSSIFTYVELINRLTTYIAAHRIYNYEAGRGRAAGNKVENKLTTNPDYQAFKQSQKNAGIEASDARYFAAFTVDKTQFLMGSDNRPVFMRNPVLGVLTQFMQFPTRYLQLISDLVFREGGVLKNPAERSTALAYMALYMMLIGGFWSLPLAENGVDLYEFIYKSMTKTDPMVKAKLDITLRELGLENPSYFTRGVLPQVANISLTTRTGLGRVIDPNFFSGDFTQTTGPAGSMIFGSVANALDAYHKDDMLGFIGNIFPTAAYNLTKAAKLGMTGQVKTAKQNRVDIGREAGAREVIPQILGFQPENIAQAQLYSFNERRLKTRVSELQVNYGNIIKSKYTDAFIALQAYNKTEKSGRPAPILLKEYKDKLKEAEDYIKEMELYNEDMKRKYPNDDSYLLNIGRATRRSWIKNASYQAGGTSPLGRKTARRTELPTRFLMANAPQRKALIERYGSEIFEELAK